MAVWMTVRGLIFQRAAGQRMMGGNRAVPPRSRGSANMQHNKIIHYITIIGLSLAMLLWASSFIALRVSAPNAAPE